MNPIIRWLKFNLVGAVGVVLQLGLLAVFAHALRWNYMLATALAVELTVLHNFVWHESFTWRDRGFRSGILARLQRFHLGNGLVSIVGNIALMRLLVGETHVPMLAANGIAILFCSLINFFLADRWIFAPLSLRTGCMNRLCGEEEVLSGAKQVVERFTFAGSYYRNG